MENYPITHLHGEENLKLADVEKSIAKVSEYIANLELKKGKHQEAIMKLDLELAELNEYLAKKLTVLLEHKKEAKNRGLLTFIEWEFQLGANEAEKITKKAKIKKQIAEINKKIAEEEEKILINRVQIAQEKENAANTRKELGKQQLKYVKLSIKPEKDEKANKLAIICEEIENKITKEKENVAMKEKEILELETKIGEWKKNLAKLLGDLQDIV